MSFMRLRNLVFLSGAVLVVLLVSGLPGLGQGVTDPSGELADAECYGHHKQEGFRSVDMFPTFITQVPKGQEFEFQMIVRNPWLHEVRDLSAYIDVSDAPGIQLEGGRDAQETPLSNETIAGGPDKYTFRSYDIPVEINATELVVSIVGGPGTPIPAPILRDRRADYDIMLTSPDGSIVLTGPDPYADPNANLVTDETAGTWIEEIRATQRNLTEAGPGVWKLQVAYRGPDTTGTYDLFTGVYYNVTGLVLMPYAGTLAPNDEAVFNFKLKVKNVDGLQRMRYGGIATAYHEHTDRNIGDIGNYDKWNTMQYETGAQLVVLGQAQATGSSADTLGPVLRRWSQVLGFAGSFLIIPSLVFGGTFGRSSVVTMNKWFNGPRRRVLFHNSMSFWLLGISLLHMFLFLYEAFWNWSHGLLWGGLSLACMIGLGVTGATQRSFVARWGFNRWRFVHFAMGVLVVVFVLVHMVADGSHLAPIRAEYFGGSSTDAGGINL